MSILPISSANAVKTCEEAKQLFTYQTNCNTVTYVLSVKSEDFFEVFLFFMSLQLIDLRPASLWFSACNPMLCALHSYRNQPTYFYS